MGEGVLGREQVQPMSSAACLQWFVSNSYSRVTYVLAPDFLYGIYRAS